jgi:integrase
MDTVSPVDTAGIPLSSLVPTLRLGHPYQESHRTTQTAVQIADLIVATVRETKTLPDPNLVRRKVRVGQDLSRSVTVGEYLERWLAGRRGLRETTRRSYAGHIQLYFLPHLGRIPLDKLRVRDVERIFDVIDELNEAITRARESGDPQLRAKVKGRRIINAATKQRIRATLRAALNRAIKERLIEVNVASLIELPSGKAPKALVWTPALTKQFLNRARQHRLYALFHLVAFRGLRRGEACGLRWSDLDLKNGAVTVRWQITQIGSETSEGKPKSEAGEATISLDASTVKELRAHKVRQNIERLAAGDAWAETGYVFTTEMGRPVNPNEVTEQFEQLSMEAGLPPVRLHDLRHGAASFLLAAGYDLKVVQETLRLSSITIAADIYTSLLPQLARKSAEDAAAIILNADTGDRPKHRGRVAALTPR